MFRGNLAAMVLGITIAWAAAPSIAAANELAGPPPVCNFPDLMTVSPVPIQPGASSPDPTDGPIPGGRWELTELFLTASIPLITLSGEGSGILEVDASGPLAGTLNNALFIQGVATAPIGDPTPFEGNLPFAGPYQASTGILNITDECNDPPLADSLDYRVDSTGPQPILTLWEAIDVPVNSTTVTISAELVYVLVDPQFVEDPIFDDRFEQQP